MKKKTLLLILVAAGTFLFNMLFWRHSLGLNLVIFVVFILGSLAVLKTSSFKKPKVLVLAATTLLLCALFIINYTLLALWVLLLSTLITAAVVHRPELKSVFYAAVSGFWEMLKVPLKFITAIENRSLAFPRMKRSMLYLQFSVMPLGVIFLFMLLYRAGNSVFNDATQLFFTKLGRFFDLLFTDFPFSRFLFVLLGLAIVAGLLVHHFRNRWWRWDTTSKEKLLRKDIRSKKSSQSKRTGIKLKYEFYAGIALFAVLNALILILNLIDIKYIWLNFTYQKGTLLKGFVHEGTNILIIAILLSMAVTLYYFRGNLNFFSRNKILTALAYLWLVQNIIMTISVGFRVFYYVKYFNLAYLRIGLAFFLVFILIGLITTIYKINRKKTNYYLLRVNSLSFFAILVVMSLFNWDVLIARYNFAHADTAYLHHDFMVKLPPKTFPVLRENKEHLNVLIPASRGYYFDNHSTYWNYFEAQEKKFTEASAQKSWKEWNWAEERAFRELAGR